MLVALGYRTPGKPVWSQEYALQLQRHGYREDVTLYPAGAFDDTYPMGAIERVDTELSSLFARAQLARALPRDGQLLAGVEYTGLLYGGDELHDANFDVDSPDATPYDAPLPVGDMYEPMKDHLVSKLGVYAQLASGALLGERLQITAGLRYDSLFFDYTAVYEDGKPTRSRSFQDLSPRLALIWQALDPLVLKLMAARAFRTPAPVELFVAHSWTASSTDIDSFRAERQDTYELAADWRIARPLKLRANGWLSALDGSIGYDVTDFAIVNRYDVWRAGGEAEVALDLRLRPGVHLDGWLSWSFVHQLSETVHDPLLGEGGRITRAPAQLGKLGARLRHGRFVLSLQGLYHGRVHRRPADLESEENRALRPDVLPAWATLDAAVQVRLGDFLRLGVVGKDLFDSGGRLMVSRDMPFDYPSEGRRVDLQLALEY
jgi:iron complex outermembrane receptor protein